MVSLTDLLPVFPNVSAAELVPLNNIVDHLRRYRPRSIAWNREKDNILLTLHQPLFLRFFAVALRCDRVCLLTICVPITCAFLHLGHNSWRLVLDTSWQRKCDVRRALSQVVGHCQGNIDRDSLGTGSKGGPTDSENDRKTLLYHQRRREKTEIQGDCIRLADIQTFFVPSDRKRFPAQTASFHLFAAKSCWIFINIHLQNIDYCRRLSILLE